MARVNIEADVPQIGRPVGSKEEIEDLGIPTRNIATCSRHLDRENMGCAMYDNCDRAFRGTTPENEIYTIVKPGGELRTTHGPCFDNVALELSSDANGGYVEIVGCQGDTYLGRGSVKLHKKRDPDCNDCFDGKCIAYVDKDDIEVNCPVFPKAATHPELLKFARRKGAAERRRKQNRDERRKLLENDEDKAERKLELKREIEKAKKGLAAAETSEAGTLDTDGKP